MIKIYNSLTEHLVSLPTALDVERDFDRLAEWCDDHLVEHGYYELDSFEEDFLIQIDDDNDDWLVNFQAVVAKVKTFNL